MAKRHYHLLFYNFIVPEDSYFHYFDFQMNYFIYYFDLKRSLKTSLLIFYCYIYYVERVLEQWITEYKIDGFRWDLTKGFTQNCTSSDETCTGNYQQDRVDVLKLYADKQWVLTQVLVFLNI